MRDKMDRINNQTARSPAMNLGWEGLNHGPLHGTGPQMGKLAEGDDLCSKGDHRDLYFTP